MLVEKRFKKIFYFPSLFLLASFFVISNADAAGLTVGNNAQVLDLPHENLYYGVTSAANDKGNFLLFEKGYGNTVFKIDYNGNITTNGSLLGSNSFWNISGDNLFASSTAWNVGIGTTTTSGLKLNVVGNARVSGVVTANSFNGTVVAPNVSAGAFAANTGGGNFSFPGNVGIGTTAPHDPLHVTGILRVGPFYSDIDRDQIELVPNGTDTRIRSLNERFHIENTGGPLILQGASGNVGIGTINPGSRLDVQAGDNAETLKLSYSPAPSSYYLKVRQNVPTGGVVVWNFDMANNGTVYNNVLAFDRGNIGIGTATPGSYKLNVNGNTNINGTLTATGISGVTVAAPNVSAGAFAANTGGGNFSFPANVDVAGVFRIGELYYSDLKSLTLPLGTESWVNLATIPNNGTIKFQIRTGSSNSEEIAEVKVFGTYHIAQTGITVERQTYNAHLREVRITGTDGGNKTVYVRVRTDSYAPTLTWRVIESKGAPIINNVEASPTGGLALLVNGNLSVNTNVGMNIGGNVGIGTTNPNVKLDVRGNLQIGNSGNTGSTNWPLFITDTNGLGWKVADGAGVTKFELYTGNGGLNEMRLFNGVKIIGSGQDLTLGTTNNVSALTIQNNAAGNVGIGTTAPGAYKLNVNGNLNVSGTVTATGISGITVAAPNVSAGNFAANTGGGDFGFPANLSVTGYINSTVGYKQGGSAASGNYLRGNGTNFVSSAIQAGDVPTLNQNTSGYAGTLVWEDNRTISPSELAANRMKFGFTAYDNNNASPWADFIHLRSYTDSSGGNDNLLVFNRNGLGARIYQQTYGSATAYTTFKDIVLADNTPATNYVTKYSSVGDNVSIAASQLYDNGTGVGIGTTAPGAYKLNVNGNTNISGTLNVTGALTAGSLSGTYNGTIGAPNVSSGTFGNNTGGGNYRFPATASAVNSFVQDTAGLKIFAPGGASYVGQDPSRTGAIKIKLPVYRTNTMMRMTVKIYQYSANKSYTIDLGGYNYYDGQWVNTFANVTGGDGGNLAVRFGNDGTNDIIWIGELGSVWTYPQVFVTDFEAGYSGYALDNWDDNWSVSFATAFDSIATIATSAFTWNNTNDGVNSGLDADLLDGLSSANLPYYPTGNNANYDVTAGDGNGLRFWNGSSAYKISMGSGSLYQYGPVTDYSIKTQMDQGSTGRGFTWGREGITPIAALNSTSGNMQIAGTMTAASFSGTYNGTIPAPNVSSGTFGANTGGGHYKFPSLVTMNTSGRFAANGDGFYFGEQSTAYRTPDVNIPAVVIRMDEANAGLDETKAALALYNANGGQNTGAGLSFVSREAVGSGNDVALSGIFGIKESAGTAGGWSQGGLRFWTKNMGNIVEAMSIRTDGNVGIGTTAPGSNLDILNTGNAWATRGIRLLGPNMTAGSSLFFSVGKADSAYNMGQVYFYQAGDNSTSNRLSFGLHSVDNVLNILGTGNVGIGTTDPGSYKLSVNGLVAWTNGNSSHLGTGANVTTYVGNSSVNNALIRSNDNNNDAWIMNWGDSASYGIYNRNIDSALVVSGALTVPANSTAFIGAGLAKAYIDHASGNAGFAGAVSASYFSGALSGTVGAANVSAGTFASNTGGGNFIFPAGLNINGNLVFNNNGISQNIIDYEYDNLFAADKKFTVTTTGFSGISNAFDARQDSAATCTSLPCSVTINMGTNHYWYGFSVAFPWGTGYGGSSNFTIEKYYDPDSTGGCDTWGTVDSVTGFSGYKYTTQSNLGNHICQFRVTFNNITGTQGQIYLAEIAGYQFYYGNSGPSVKRYGDTLYGGLSFSGVSTDITTPSGEHLALVPGGSGNVGIGTTDPGTYKLNVNGATNVSGAMNMAGGASVTGNLAVTGQITANKLNVNTIDPLYNIKGTNYASFAASVVGGVKEEVMGKLKINTKNGSEYQAIINFDKEPQGTDLWVWRKVIDFSKDNVEVNITPYGSFANTYYYISGNSIVFKADRPTEISYRLTAKRFDWKNWPTIPVDQTEKAGMIIK